MPANVLDLCPLNLKVAEDWRTPKAGARLGRAPKFAKRPGVRRPSGRFGIRKAVVTPNQTLGALTNTEAEVGQ
jgi:hypothetical protein